MKYLFQFAIICACALVGEILNTLIPLPIPAMVYGLVVLFTLLTLKIVPLSAVEETSTFLVSLMGFILVPIFIAIMEIAGELHGAVIPLLLIMLITTAITMGITGIAAQALMPKDQPNPTKKGPRK